MGVLSGSSIISIQIDGYSDLLFYLAYLASLYDNLYYPDHYRPLMNANSFRLKELLFNEE